MRITWLRGRGLLLFGMLVGTGACARTDARLEKLTVGMSKDSVRAVMGNQPVRADAYLDRGQYIEALYFAKPGSTTSDSVPDRSMSPVVLIGGRLSGWGWTFWDSVAADHKIEIVPK